MTKKRSSALEAGSDLRPETTSVEVLFEPKQLVLSCLSGELLYDAAARSGFRLPVACRNGVCEICRAKVLSGQFELGRARAETEKGPKEALLCQLRPVSDCTIEMNNVYGRGELPLKQCQSRVVAVNPLQAHIYQVELELPAGKLPERFAGQYLSLAIPELDIESYFSIANAPEGRRIELHIQADPHIESALKIISALSEASLAQLTLPMGKASLLEPPKGEVILMAAGTGFAQMKAIIEQLLAWQVTSPIYLYWGVRSESDLYLKSLAESWVAEHSNIHFKALVAEHAETESEQEHYDQLANAVLADEHQLANAQIFISGSPRLVYQSMDILEARGAKTEQFLSDVFEYAERPEPKKPE